MHFYSLGINFTCPAGKLSGRPACPAQELTCPGQADRGFVVPCPSASAFSGSCRYATSVTLLRLTTLDLSVQRWFVRCCGTLSTWRPNQWSPVLHWPQGFLGLPTRSWQTLLWRAAPWNPERNSKDSLDWEKKTERIMNILVMNDHFESASVGYEYQLWSCSTRH